MFCPWTPGGELAKRWRQVERQGAPSRGWRYKVVELSGRPVASILCTNPWAGPCTDETCFICTTGGTGPCGRTGCNYVVTCLTCRDTGPSTVPTDREEQDERQTKKIVVGQPAISKYYGESGYSGNVRGRGRGPPHWDGQKRPVQCPLPTLSSLPWRAESRVLNVSPVKHQQTLHQKNRGRCENCCGGSRHLNSREEFLQGAIPSTRVQRGFA